MFEGFQANKTFWTDSNGLEMQERRWQTHKYKYKADGQEFSYYNIPANYYPIDTAIAIRDFSNASNIQVTIMNDRP